jgi:hypothetical protein
MKNYCAITSAALIIIVITITYYVCVYISISKNSMDSFQIATLQSLILIVGNLLIVFGAIYVSNEENNKKVEQQHLNDIKREVIKPWLEHNYSNIAGDYEKICSYDPINKPLYKDTEIHFPKIFEIKKELEKYYDTRKEIVKKIQKENSDIEVKDIIFKLYNENYTINKYEDRFAIYIYSSWAVVIGTKIELEQFVKNLENNIDFKNLVSDISKKEKEFFEEIYDISNKTHLEKNKCNYLNENNKLI